MPLYDGTGSLDMFDAHPRDLGWARIDYTAVVECWLWVGASPPDPTWEVGSQVNNEVAANDYVRTPLPDQAWVQVGKLARLQSSPVELLAQTTFVARGYILVLRVGTDATSPVLTWGYLDNTLFDEKTVINPEILRITPSANGWYDVNNR